MGEGREGAAMIARPMPARDIKHPGPLPTLPHAARGGGITRDAGAEPRHTLRSLLTLRQTQNRAGGLVPIQPLHGTDRLGPVSLSSAMQAASTRSIEAPATSWPASLAI